MSGHRNDGGKLCRLLYTSRCKIGGTSEERDAAVRAIAQGSSRRNRVADLTGTLLFIDGSFTQVLEGPSEPLERVFETICRDFRHEDVKLIDFNLVPSRLFDRWDMAVLTDCGETAIPLRDGLQEVRFLVGVNAEEALRQMRELLDRQDQSEVPPRAVA